MARPRKEPSKTRRHRISYTVTDDELAVLEAAMRKMGRRSIHAAARDLALRRKVAVTNAASFSFDVAKELRALGVNLNQQTRKLHVTGNVPPELRSLWAKLDGLLTWMIDHGSADRRTGT